MLIRAGEAKRAEEIRRANLKRLASSGFAEYFEPFTGNPLGASDQSWTVAPDWLAKENEGNAPPRGGENYGRLVALKSGYDSIDLSRLDVKPAA